MRIVEVQVRIVEVEVGEPKEQRPLCSPARGPAGVVDAVDVVRVTVVFECTLKEWSRFSGELRRKIDEDNLG